MRCSVFITVLAFASLLTGLGAANRNLISESQPILQPGTLPASGQGPLNARSMPKIPADIPRMNRKSGVSVGPGSLPLAAAAEPDAAQKYGTNPGALQIHFGHRR
jgi:hypothetical protein